MVGVTNVAARRWKPARVAAIVGDEGGSFSAQAKPAITIAAQTRTKASSTVARHSGWSTASVARAPAARAASERV
jgi:hypothetical protein